MRCGRELRDAGAEFQPAEDIFGTGGRGFTRDPAGNRIELIASAVSDDHAAVTALLGRVPRSAVEVVVRHADGSPVVIRNPPILDDGTPMPTRYWLVGEPERDARGRRSSRPAACASRAGGRCAVARAGARALRARA